jgi:myo-inositol-1(or 4)-monophosphatase
MKVNEATTLEWQQWCTAAADEARSAGALLRRLLADPRQVQSKGFRDLVTDADFAAQEQITRGLRQAFPEHGFWAEEEDSNLPTTGPVRWMIDPVDGTTNYSRGIPNFCVSIAAAVAETVVVGVIYDPLRDELFRAVRGQGCTVNDRPVTVSHTSNLAEGAIAIDYGRRRVVRERAIAALLSFVHDVRNIRSIGSAALALAWVAAGRLDAYLSFELGAWDIAAGALMIHEAGGQVSTMGQEPLGLVASTSCAASNGLLHGPLLGLVEQAIQPISNE